MNQIVTFITAITHADSRHPKYVGSLHTTDAWGYRTATYKVFEGMGCRLLAHFPGQGGIHTGTFVSRKEAAS